MTRTGPIEENDWPAQIDAHVVTPGASPRMHGYDVEGDLARHGSFADTILLALTGELPTKEQSTAFDVAMTFLAPLSVAEAPTHAAALASICGARPSAVTSTAAIALAERARAIVAGNAASSANAEPTEPLDSDSVTALRAALANRGVAIPALDAPRSRSGALLETLRFAGLTRAEHLETAIVVASLACVVGEAHAHRPLSFREYPIKLPPFAYEDP